MTIYIGDENQVLQDLEEALIELEQDEVSEAIRRACQVDFTDLINPFIEE